MDLTTVQKFLKLLYTPLPESNFINLTTKVLDELTLLNLHTHFDLILHLPYQYKDKTHITAISDLMENKFAVVEGRVEKAIAKTAGKRFFKCQIVDSSGSIEMLLFNFNPYQIKALKFAKKIRVSGQPKLNNFRLEFIHPEYKALKENEVIPLEEKLTPVYSLSSISKSLNQKKIAELIFNLIQHLKLVTSHPLEPLFHKMNMPSFFEALELLHQPLLENSIESILNGIDINSIRIACEEILANFLALRFYANANNKIPSQKIIYQATQSKLNQIITHLDFPLTSCQLSTLETIKQDLQQSKPMNRLVQGDVGCGKTIVAILASLVVLENNCQVSILAPTQLLAEQHFKSFNQILEPLGYRIALLTGKMTQKQKNQIKKYTQLGTIDLLVGTHALIEEDLNFKNLNLIVVDEQQRFGVNQRFQLKEKNANFSINQLYMTATPIPRTLFMALFSHMDISSIKTMPQGRLPVSTIVMSENKKQNLYDKLEKLAQEQAQFFWVCPLIDESEFIEATSAKQTYQELKDTLKINQVGLLHGEIKAKEKTQIVKDFIQKKLTLLVATTVIEVGINIPNANYMIIENAERLGMSQLHQLRGRVGRDKEQGYCILLYKEPLSENSKKRLDYFRKHNSGFDIAEYDLKMRGAGEILGTKQSGIVGFKCAKLNNHLNLIKTAKEQSHLLSDEQKKILVQVWFNNKDHLIQV